MNNGITTRAATPGVPARVADSLLLLKESPQRYIDSTTPEKYDAPRPDNAPMLSHINRGIGRDYTMMALSLMIKDVNDFFNIKGRMNDRQIALTARLILDNPAYYDLTIGNIKACFEERMTNEKIYDRLDGNIIIGWLRDFKSRMADHCALENEGRDRMRQREEQSGGAGGITMQTYMAMLRARADSGDKEAERTLSEMERRLKGARPEEARQKEIDFRIFKARYLKEKYERDSRHTPDDKGEAAKPQDEGH